MSLISWNPFREVDSISRDMETFFERSPFGFFSRATAPRVDVFETEKDVVVKAEIPGVSKEDLNVYVDENSIRLSGETKRDTEYKNEHIYRTERYYASFSRTIPLPVEVKSEQAKAEYKDGILTVTVPKVETTQMKGKKIDIH